MTTKRISKRDVRAQGVAWIVMNDRSGTNPIKIAALKTVQLLAHLLGTTPSDIALDVAVERRLREKGQ